MTCLVLTSQDEVCLDWISVSKRARPKINNARYRDTHPSENWTMRPFLDHPSQLGPGCRPSPLFNTLTTFAASIVLDDLAMLQTRKSPSWVCVASISDFCREDEACHARVTIGDGPLDVVRLCKMVNLGCKAAIKREPLENLKIFVSS